MSGEPINDGGSAFPVPPPIAETDGVMMQWSRPEPGMSLRDWFASRATDKDIQPYESMYYQDGERRNCTIKRERAKYAYADAMLAARTEKGVIA